MKSLCAASLILIFGWHVSCVPVDSSCPDGLASQIDKRTVLVIDVSASMESQEKLKEVGSTLETWIFNQKPCSGQLGIVEFASSARTLNDLTNINEESRNELIKNIPTRPQGDTCIPCGLKEAIKILGNSKNATDRPIIVLITDAVDSELDLDEDNFMEFMEASQARVIVAVLSNDLTVLNHTLNDIEKLTKVTGGFSQYIQDENLQKELLDMLIGMENLAVNNATTTLPETTEEITTSIPISNETIKSAPTTQTSNESSDTRTTDTPLEETSIALDDVTNITVLTVLTTSAFNVSYTTNSVTTFEANETVVTSITSTTAPMTEGSSLLLCIGIFALAAIFLAIIIMVAYRCCKKRNKRPCASHGSYAPIPAPIPLRTRPIHGDQVLAKYATRPNSSYS